MRSVTHEVTRGDARRDARALGRRSRPERDERRVLPPARVRGARHHGGDDGVPDGERLGGLAGDLHPRASRRVEERRRRRARRGRDDRVPAVVHRTTRALDVHARRRALGDCDVLGVLGEELGLERVSDAADHNAAPAPVKQVATLFVDSDHGGLPARRGRCRREDRIVGHDLHSLMF